MDSKLPEGALPINDLVGMRLDSVERLLIERTLERHGGNKSAASRTLGICVRTLRNKLRKYAKDDQFNLAIAA